MRMRESMRRAVKPGLTASVGIMRTAPGCAGPDKLPERNRQGYAACGNHVNLGPPGFRREITAPAEAHPYFRAAYVLLVRAVRSSLCGSRDVSRRCRGPCR